MRTALHAEWTKLRTVLGPRALLLAAIALTVALSTAVACVTACGCASCGQDATRLELAGVGLGQAPIAVLAVPAIGGEYSTGMIQTTLAAMPHRAGALAAKAVALAAAAAGAGTLAVLGALLAGRLILPGRGFTAAHGCRPRPRPTHPPCAPQPDRSSTSP
jgi:ABC-2 type transport system permease protein